MRSVLAMVGWVALAACSGDGTEPSTPADTATDTDTDTDTTGHTGTTGPTGTSACVPPEPLQVAKPDPRAEVAGDPSVDGMATDLSGLGATFLRSADGGTNAVVSPVSLAGLLTLMAIDAEPPLAPELQAVFASDDLLPWTQAFAAYTADVQAPPALRHGVVQHARGLFYGPTPSEPWLGHANDQGVHLAPLDFAGDTEGARGTINGWVEDGTGCMIPELVPVGVLSGSTQVVLVDALAVAADWVQEFPDEYDRPFTLPDGAQVDVPMVGGHATVYRTTVSGAEVVTLPTRDPTLSYRIVLPASPTTADDLLQTLDGPTMQSWLALGSSDYVDLSMPMLGLSTSIDLVERFDDLGLPSLPENPSWGSLCPTCSALGAARQQVVVEVGAQGMRAAAASYGSGVDSAPPPLRVDRPFLFLIVDEAAQVPWFVGIVRDPREP